MTLKPTPNVKKLEFRLFKRFLLFLFQILPIKVSKIFVSIALVSYINIVRGEKELVDKEKFNSLLKGNYGDEVYVLPEMLSTWFWDDTFLSKRIFSQGKSITIKEAINNRLIFNTEFEKIMAVFLNNLPRGLKNKIYSSDPKGSVLCGNVFYMLSA